MHLRDAIEDLAPPLLVRLARSVLRRGTRFSGDHESWEQALRGTTGYGDERILQRVLEAELKVKRGEAEDARDGVTFSRIQFSLPMMAGLARAQARARGPLRVLDIGGALGGLYRQFKSFLPQVRVSWTVVEQAGYVAAGRTHLASEELTFVTDMSEALVQGRIDVVLLSSVLQYLPDPYGLIRQVVSFNAPEVLIDRTTCSSLERDALTVQHVPPEIYPGSYPCWVFSRDRLVEAFAAHYDVLATYVDGGRQHRASFGPVTQSGFLLTRRS